MMLNDSCETCAAIAGVRGLRAGYSALLRFNSLSPIKQDSSILQPHAHLYLD